ncbi:MAG: hypothetical protein ACE5G2_05950 [Candidatus Krumholzibacteriia bacterium]
MRRKRPVVGIVLLVALLGLALGCRREVAPLFRSNVPPETTLTIIAEESTLAFYRYHVYWRGEDRDGEAVRYFYAITDTLSRNEEENWDPSLADDRDRGRFTTKTDSVFLFDSAVGRQAFNIVAIDDFGEMDPTPARAFFRIVDNGLPRIQFIDVTAYKEGLVPCASADPCTVPTFTDFKVRFSGTTRNGFTTGYTWQIAPPNWEPSGDRCDTCFVDAHRDTTVLDAQGDTLWSLARDTVSVFVRSDRDDPVDPGRFPFRTRVRDDARLMSLLSAGERLINVNYDPDTRLYRIPECQCPNAPPDCDGGSMVPLGWVTGFGETVEFPLSEWRPFCPGDTIPNFATVTFYARGWDDPRDEANDPAIGLLETEYRFRFEAETSRFSNRNQEFSFPAKPAQDLPLPGGGTFRGAAISWTTCPLDYKLEASSVDEQAKVDGTPDSLVFHVGGAPTIDSVSVPAVMVFMPACGQLGPLCPNPSDYEFGPDTLVVVGIHPDVDTLGTNNFVLPFKAWAHDHPRDRDPEAQYDVTRVGRIRAWRFSFDCVNQPGEPPCQDVQIHSEDNWRREERGESDPQNQEVFDENLMVLDVELDVVPLDVFPFGRAVLKLTRSKGPYEFTLEGRDTADLGQRCSYPLSLSEPREYFDLDISSLGRTTQLLRRTVIWRQLTDVRPLPKPSPPASPFANRKKPMR